tara:strand:- start:126 stop:1565 length:1440 start_codon:yes stop_codon:yes gene_type:complete
MAVVTRVDLLKNRRTKTVATVGPVSSSSKTIEQLLLAGVNVFRLNMSHGDHASHEQVFQKILTASDRLQRPVGILVDLCGPKIRTGRFEGGAIKLVDGDVVTLTTRDGIGKPGLIISKYENLCSDVVPDDTILLADGLLELRVMSATSQDAVCRVIHGGTLADNKGINLPGVAISAPSLTPKDIEDARFALSLGVDYMALSFVREARDVEQLRELVGDHDVRLIAKIEKPEALVNAEEILAVTDGVMVARGDLGVELPPEEVPIAQNQLISLARSLGKPVIVATQMLESMMVNARPSRAEVTDVSHAVVSGADAVILSGETAAGDHPVDAVEMMDRIARQTEAHLWSSGQYGLPGSEEPPLALTRVIGSATAIMSRDLLARAVLCVTQTGISAYIVSSARPAAPIIAVTGNQQTYNRLALLWGVVPILDTEAGRANPNELARKIALELALGTEGQHVLLVRGFHGDKSMNLPSVTAVTI